MQCKSFLGLCSPLNVCFDVSFCWLVCKIRFCSSDPQGGLNVRLVSAPSFHFASFSLSILAAFAVVESDIEVNTVLVMVLV